MRSKKSTKKIVYFVRHGQSDDNVAAVFQGVDSPLSKTGHEQASKIANRINEADFQALISSPQSRAKTTAEAIAKLTDKPVELSDLFVERIKPTSVNGKPYSDTNAAEIWRKWEVSMTTPGTKIEDGENYDEIVERADQALKFLYDYPAKNLVVVTHGYFLRVLVARVLLDEQLNSKSFKKLVQVTEMENTGVTVIVYEDAFEQPSCWRLWMYNDHSHLTE